MHWVWDYIVGPIGALGLTLAGYLLMGYGHWSWQQAKQQAGNIKGRLRIFAKYWGF